MAFTYVAGSVTGTIDSVGGASHGVTLNQTSGAGDLLIGEFLWDGLGTGAVSDPSNGTWTPIGTVLTGTGSLSAFRGQFFYIAAAAAAKPLVTLTITGGSTPTFIAFEIVEYSYTGGTLAIDGTPSYTNATAIAGVVTTGTVTTTGTSGVGVAAVFAVDSGAGALAPYTLRDDGTYNAGTGALLEDKTGINAGIQVATMSAGTTDNTMLGLVAFKTGSSTLVAEDDSYRVNIVQSFDPVVTIWQ